jgi:uncharacterized cupin superfamily protein
VACSHRCHHVGYGARVGNVFRPEWDAEQDRSPFTWRRARLGRQAGTEKLGASLFELPPGCSSFPLHIHHANEELIVVIAGRPTLRTLTSELVLEPGQVVACPAGRRGAHRLDNRSEEPARVLIVSTMLAPELNEYPDSGKLWARNYPPGGEPGEEAVELIARPEDSVHYLDGEV